MAIAKTKKATRKKGDLVLVNAAATGQRGLFVLASVDEDGIRIAALDHADVVVGRIDESDILAVFKASTAKA